MQIRFLGSGTPLGDGGRFQACVLLESGSSRVLIDCGMTSLVALARAQVDWRVLDAILVSHLHGDHFGGLALVLLAAAVSERRADDIGREPRRLVIAGPRELRARLRDAIGALGWSPAWSGSEDPPSVAFRPIAIDEMVEVAGLSVRATRVSHSPDTFPTALRIEAEGKVLAYSGDAGWSPDLLRAARASDLFICAAPSYDHGSPGFLDYATLRRHREELACRQLILTHVGPDLLAHRDEIVADGVQIAEDDMVVAL